MLYDIAEIRGMAREAQFAADSIRDASDRQLRNACNITEQTLQGQTAEKLSGVLATLNQDFRGLASDLSSIASELSLYATRVEDADRLAREKIREK